MIMLVGCSYKGHRLHTYLNGAFPADISSYGQVLFRFMIATHPLYHPKIFGRKKKCQKRYSGMKQIDRPAER
jgi:hypothetical protein